MSIQQRSGGLAPPRGSEMIQQEEFKVRFKGRTHIMNKEGHMGVVKNTLKPIVKGINDTTSDIEGDSPDIRTSQRGAYI